MTRKKAPAGMEEDLSQVTRHRTRAAKIAKGEPKVVKEKFILPENEEVVEKTMKFSPRGANQKTALAYMREGRKIIFLSGCAGVGKSLLAAYHASELLKTKKIDKVFIARPIVGCGKSLGALPGDTHSKLLAWSLQTLSHFEKFLGKGPLQYYLDHKIIELAAIEYMRGTSFESCVVIAEEAQNLTVEEFEMMMTRVGENAQIIFTGDQKQSDKAHNAGLPRTLALLEKVKAIGPTYLDTEDLNEILTNIGVVNFTFEDVQRSPMVKALTKIYYHEEK